MSEAVELHGQSSPNPNFKAPQAKAIRNKRVTSASLGSEPGFSDIKFAANKFESLAFDLPWEVLDWIELIATYNPDFSQAVENIQKLANTGHELIVDAGSDLQQKRVKALLEEKASSFQAQHGGVDGIIDKLLWQGAVFGAMCGEIVLSDDLAEVIDFVEVNPKTIRFLWDERIQNWAPYQKVSAAKAKEAEKQGQNVVNNCVELNTMTFRYQVLHSFSENPYGVPPFIAAIRNINIQDDLVTNMAAIVKKIALLGVVDLNIERLKPLPGESDEAYTARATQYLEAYSEIAESMMEDGGVVHYDDMTVHTWQIGGNAAGATNIFKQNEELIFSGLKSMPSIQGRSYSTTETYAGVAYDIMIRNTHKYQRGVKRMIEAMYRLTASLAGLNPTKIALMFSENRSLNREQEASAERVEIGNAFTLWLMGIIDQVGAAQRLGYSEPTNPMEDPPESLIGIQSAHGIFDVPNVEFHQHNSSSSNLEDSDE